MIPRIGEREVTRLRYGQPTALDAREIAIRPVPTSEPVRITTDQAPQSVIMRAPQGTHPRDVLFFITYDDVRQGSTGGASPTWGTYADRLVVDGVSYDVQEVWTVPAWMGDPTHREGYAIVVQPLTTDTQAVAP